MGGLPRGAVAALARSADRGVADRPGQDSAHAAGHGRNLGRIPHPRRLCSLRRAAAQAVGVPRTLQGHRQHLQQCLRLQRPEALDHERLFPPARPARPLRGGLQRQRCRLRQLRQGGRREEHTLPVDEMPSHAHGENLWTGGNGSWRSGGNNSYPEAVSWHDRTTPFGTTDRTGGGSSHENRPPYYTLAYVMRTK